MHGSGTINAVSLIRQAGSEKAGALVATVSALSAE
jgi:hypothetical protein